MDRHCRRPMCVRGSRLTDNRRGVRVGVRKSVRGRMHHAESPPHIPMTLMGNRLDPELACCLLGQARS